jgi:tetratricopeptide (TPR) repeat protein
MALSTFRQFFKFLAILCFITAISCTPPPPSSGEVPGTFADAQKFYDQGQPDKSEKILLFLKARKPSDVKVHQLLGRIYKDGKRTDEATAELEGVVNLDPHNANAFATLARLYQSKGLFDQALASALEAKKLDPEGSVYNILGTVYFDKGDYQSAVKNYEKALTYEEDSAWVYNNLGLVYIQMQKWPEAEAQLKKAIEADSENAIAHNNLGVVFNQEKEYEKGLKEFETACSLDPQYQKASQNLTDTRKLLERLKKKTAAKNNGR